MSRRKRKDGRGSPGEMVPWRVAPALLDAVRTQAETSGRTPGEVHSSALALGLGIAEAPNTGRTPALARCGATSWLASWLFLSARKRTRARAGRTTTTTT